MGGSFRGRAPCDLGVAQSGNKELDGNDQPNSHDSGAQQCWRDPSAEGGADLSPGDRPHCEQGNGHRRRVSEDREDRGDDAIQHGREHNPQGIQTAQVIYDQVREKREKDEPAPSAEVATVDARGMTPVTRTASERRDPAIPAVMLRDNRG